MTHAGPPWRIECAPGADPVATTRTWLAGWLSTPEWARLVELSGHRELRGGLAERLPHAIQVAEGWDFRSGRERADITAAPAVLAGQALDEAEVGALATALGLGATPLPVGPFSHAVVLGGTARACWNRTQLAADLVDSLGISSVVALTAERPLSPAEQTAGVELGLGALHVEREAATAALVARFPPDGPDELDEGRVVGGAAGADDEEEADRRRRWSHRSWRSGGRALEVVSAPSADPVVRRANTEDQLRFWAERVGLDAGDRLLLVTTEHYVPYQQLVAMRALGRSIGCGLQTVGTPWVSSGPHRAAGYLQELRSALLAAAALASDA